MEEMNCPICNKKMILKKESGFLGGEFLECESCNMSFKQSGKNYHLKDFKEKTFLEKYKNSFLPYDEWMKVGAGQKTVDEDKEYLELELIETLDLKCPNCNSKFNKFHKKGLLSFDSIICPTCTARFEIINDKYKFIDINDIHSELWEIYNQTLTMEEIYSVFNKKLEIIFEENTCPFCNNKLLVKKDPSFFWWGIFGM